MTQRRHGLTACRATACLAFMVAVPALAQDARGPAPVVSEQAFDCVIEPQQTVKLSSAVVGVVRTVAVDRGDLVSKGDVVAKLEAGVEEANLALARVKASSDYAIKSKQAQLEFLRRKHERAGELVGKKIVAEATFEEALANAEMAVQGVREAEVNQQIAVLEVKQAEAVVEQRTVRSPLDGVVTEVSLRPGEYRNDQSPIMTLAQIDPLRVEVFVPTPFYGQIKIETIATVEPEAPIGGQYDARVTVVDRVMDASSGTFGVRLALPNPDHLLPAGLRCKIRFPGATTAAALTAAK
jgi:RND family efflux transporter MFP subunit